MKEKEGRGRRKREEEEEEEEAGASPHHLCCHQAKAKSPNSTEPLIDFIDSRTHANLQAQDWFELMEDRNRRPSEASGPILFFQFNVVNY